MYMQHVPGEITVPQEVVIAHLPGVLEKIHAHIEAWLASVPSGTTVTVFELLTYDVVCACPPAGWQHTKKCPGFAHGMPMELVMGILFPPDGSPCAIDGIECLTPMGPLEEWSLGLPKKIVKL